MNERKWVTTNSRAACRDDEWEKYVLHYDTKEGANSKMGMAVGRGGGEDN